MGFLAWFYCLLVFCWVFLKHMVGQSVFCEICVCSVAVIKMSNFKLMSRTEKSIIKLKWAVLLEWFLGLDMVTWVELTA